MKKKFKEKEILVKYMFNPPPTQKKTPMYYFLSNVDDEICQGRLISKNQ